MQKSLAENIDGWFMEEKKAEKQINDAEKEVF